MELKKIELSKIKPHEKNARKNDEAVEYVIKSIEQCEYIAPIILDENNVILAGHTRYKALKKLGYKEAECVIKEGLTEEQKKKYRLLDNKTAEFAEWDFDLLEDELSGLDFGDLDIDWGVEVPEFDKEQEIVEDEVPEIPENPKAKYGDIYQLGNHRLMCGDSTKKEDIEKLMNGEKADMLFTDPPYNMSDNPSGFISDEMKSKLDNIVNFDPLTIADNLFLLGCKNWFIFTSKDLIPIYFEIFKNQKFNILVWCKDNPTPMTNNTFLPDVEYLLYFYDKGRIWNNGLNVEVYKKYYNSNKLEGRYEAGNVHPTIKPLQIISDKIKICSNKCGIVVDCFCGSGSTLIAAEHLGRKCYAMELDPHYVDVIIERWENLTGQKAVKINEQF